jgi:hypothetical protein
MNQISPVETLKWSWVKARDNLLPGLRVGLIVGVVFGVGTALRLGFIYGISGIGIAVNIGLIYGLSGFGTGLIFILLRGLTGTGIETSTVPNQGIWQSAKNALILSLIAGLSLAVVAQLVGDWPILSGSVIGLLFGIMFGLVSLAGLACLQHLTLRLVLYFSGYIPWNYARFLDYTTQLIFLQKVGGGYIFIHRLLLEHFAALEFGT